MDLKSFRKTNDVEKVCGKCYHLGGVMCSECWCQDLNKDTCDHFIAVSNSMANIYKMKDNENE